MSPRYLIPTPRSLTALPCGCRGQQPVSTTVSPEEAVVTRARTESFPHIRAVTPDEVPFTDDKAILGSFHVTYEIEAPELLTNARLELRTDRSLIARVDAPIQSHGEVDLHVDNDVTIGPTINLTMRMQMRRFTRLTNAFSKKVENHAAAVALRFMHYNFCQIPQTLRVTPAMEAGLTDHIWSLGELVALLRTSGSEAAA